jgi:hypothetical protein
MADGRNPSEVLDRRTCLELESVAIGRVAWTTEDGRVEVLPVSFVPDGTIPDRQRPVQPADHCRLHDLLLV